ncbi:MAG: NADH-quinone oxidoreductase subunit K [Holosporales bacterium]|jgi:NADH:ubiquinone oxidoreductase subunit K|nr:NADH-quinone oxidoreductase subunit K [Holosporales bacterium]
MIDQTSVLIFTFFLFIIGFFGFFVETQNIIRMFISVEIMVIASIINFCYFSNIFNTKIGHIFSGVIIVLSAIVFTIVFAISNLCQDKGDLLSDE